MKQLLKKDLLRRYHVFLIVGFLGLFLGFIFIVEQGWLPTGEDINRKDSIKVDGALLSYEIVDAKDGDALYQNLLKQKRELAKQSNSMLFKDTAKYEENVSALAKLRKEAMGLPGYEEIQQLQPTLNEVMAQTILLSRGDKGQTTTAPWKKTGVDLLLSFLYLLGLVWLPISAFVTSNVLKDELQHSSVVKGQPIMLSQRLLINAIGKFMILFGGVSISLLVGSIVLSMLGYDFSDWTSSTIAFLNGPILILKWQKIILYFGLFMGWFVVTYLLSFLLNTLTANLFLTCLIECSLYGAVMTLMNLSAPPSWFMGYYFSPSLYLDGSFWLKEGSTPTIWAVIVSFLSLCCILGYLSLKMYRKGDKQEVWQ